MESEKYGPWIYSFIWRLGSDYDATVHGADKQYAAVFKGYDSILDSIVALSGSNVLEFGPGTGI